MPPVDEAPEPVDVALETVPETRERLLHTHAGLVERLEEVRMAYAATDDPEPAGDLLAAEDLIVAAAGSIREQYRELVPIVPLSRNPLSGDVVSHSLDFYGLDGWWWDIESPVRPIEYPVEGLVAFTGALALGGEVENTPFLVRPGPAVPFVIPEILSVDGVVAVLSAQPVGNHLGYVVTYFAPEFPRFGPRANDWGLNSFTVVAEDGSLGWADEFHIEEDYDFDLVPWLDAGSLLWIEPGDDDLTLQHGAGACPYVGLAGTRAIQRVKDGQVWDSTMVV